MSNDTPFNIFDKLREWSADLDNWQKLALLKLLGKEILDDTDYKAIYEEFKIDKGLITPPVERKIYDMNSSSIPQPIQQDQRLCLSQIKDVKGVNAITDGQILHFGPMLTVIFGVNGSGKSGYARILKSACFTRSSDTTIHGNVNLPINQRITASAMIVFSDGTSVLFNKGTSCAQLRDNFAVFDTSCIRVGIDDKNEFMVNPYGFDVFQGMVDVTTKVKSQLEVEIESKTPNLVPFRLEDSSSPVAILLNSLSKDTDLAELKKLGMFSPEDGQRLQRLKIEFEELGRKDKAIILKEKRINGADIKAVIKKLNGIDALMRSDAYTRGESILNEVKKLKDVATAASAVQFSKEPVQPVGTETWRALIEAAIKYNAEAFPGQSFPPPDSQTARCLLCHQPLDKEARQRLDKFFVYIRSEAERNLKKGIEGINSLGQAISKIDFDFFRSDMAGYRVLNNYNPAVVQQVSGYIASVKTLRDAIIKSLKDGKWELPQLSLTSSIPACVGIRNQLAKEIRSLRSQDISKQKKAMADEIQLLSDQQYLFGIRDSVEKSVLDLKWIEKSQEPKRGLTTQRITIKQKALMTELMGKGFKGEFEKECVNLGLNCAPIKINISGAEAVTRRNLTIGRDDISQPDPSGILSEGEQTAVAMADFLTEIGLGKAPIGIIFDDPVNSMDHLRKEKIAQRLVRESCRRQVIIFTHDVLFTHYLVSEAQDFGTDKMQFMACTVSVGDDKTPGHVDKVVFPHVYHEDEAEKVALQYLEEARKLSGKDQLDKLKLGIGALRTAYENFIQKRIFNDVVRRWRENLKVTNLSAVFFNSEIADFVVEQFGHLSRYLEGHSHSPECQEVPLSLDVLEKEIKTFQEFRNKYSQKRSKFLENQKAKKDVFV